MSLYPSGGGGGGTPDSIYPDTTPGVNAWSQFPAVSDATLAGFSLDAVNQLSATTIISASDISGGGNVFVGGYIQATGKIETSGIQIPNETTSSIINTIETDASGNTVIIADGGGLTVLNGSAPATINAGSLALTGAGTITGAQSVSLTGTGTITGAQSVGLTGAGTITGAQSLAFTGTGAITGVATLNGQALSGIVVNPLSGNLNANGNNISNVGTITTTNATTTNLSATNLTASLNAGANNITSIGSLGANVLTFPTTTFTPTYNTGQIWFDGSVFQFSSPVSVPLPGSGYGPVNIVQNKANGGNVPSYYRYNQGVIPWSGRLTQPNPFGTYGTLGVNCYWLVSFGGTTTVSQYMNINPGVGYISSMIQNWSIIQVNITCSNMTYGADFTTSADYIMCGNGTCTSSNEGIAPTITTSNQLRLIRKVVPYGDAGAFNQGDLYLSFTLIKGVHYANSDSTLDFFFTPSGTQQFGNIYGSSPPGTPLNWEIIGIM